MKIKKLLFLVVISVGIMTLMSTTCDKVEDPAGCSGVASATATGEISQSFCFDEVTSFTYDPENRLSFWAKETSTDYGFDFSIYAQNDQSITPGTYQCGPDNPGFVELITAQDGDFYKSQSGTITISSANQTSMSGSFNVVCEGYYNKKTINFSGTFSN
ncbi:MAG: hypothetical protein C0598_10960 [Marinilabiliales bacterium]|nr:MAG: hypothetical protein C0598_10960 [Marinilabiliales bacterium]